MIQRSLSAQSVADRDRWKLGLKKQPDKNKRVGLGVKSLDIMLYY